MAENPPTGPRTAHIRFFAEVNRETINTLIGAVERKLSEGVGRIVLSISSSGGKVAAGIAGYNFLKGSPVELMTYNFGNVESIATVLYCAGAKRLCAPSGRFLLHGVVANFKSGQYNEPALRARIDSLQSDRATIARILAEACGRTMEQVEQDMLQGRLLTAQEAVAYGLVQAIQPQVVEAGVEVITVL